MYPLNRKYQNENGLSLVELLAVIVLIGIVTIILFSMTTKAIENTRIISQETVLRDEADIIVSKFIKTLYSTRQDHIIYNITTSGGNSYLEVTNDLSKCRRDENGKFLDTNGNVLNNDTLCKPTLKPIGFKTENGITIIHISNETYKVSNNNIQVLPTSKVNGSPEETSIYEIELNLSITHTRGNKQTTKEMTFKNEIQPIVNKK
jgi:Tfp pilus assembly protein PilE